MRLWIRTCQSCGNRQGAKPPMEYKDEAWREIKCRKCKSIDLDYGSWADSNPNYTEDEP
jgi:hypothetical protein